MWVGGLEINPRSKEFKVLRELLEPGEKVGVEIVERRLGGAKWFGVAHAYATNSRILIIRIYTFGFHTSIKIIQYKDITEVKIERGIAYCKIHFSLQGEDPEAEEHKKWFMGIKYPEALILLRYVNHLTGGQGIKTEIVK